MKLSTAKQHIKFVIEKNAKFSLFALSGFVTPVYGEHSGWESRNSCSELLSFLFK
jgi:hypothetical protein